jgi:hypothetical protein
VRTNTTTAAVTDEALLQAVAGGDRAALRTLYERHAPWLTLRRRTVGSVRATIRKDGAATVRLRYTKAAAKRLRTARKVTLTIAGAGARATVVLRR